MRWALVLPALWALCGAQGERGPAGGGGGSGRDEGAQREVCGCSIRPLGPFNFAVNKFLFTSESTQKE